MLGIIKTFVRSQGFGFLVDEHGTRRFFHIANIEDGSLRHGDTVQFEPYEEPRGPAATAIKLISTISAGDTLVEIAQWKLEARLEDNTRYFYHTQDVDLIESGSQCYVIGRKGTGKTAIGEYLTGKKEPLRFARKLTFKNYPFNELYALRNDRYTAPNQYITLWKYLIYASVAQMMAENQNIAASLRIKLEALFVKDSTTTLEKRISRWTGRSFEFKILGTGFSLGAPQAQAVEESWIDRVSALETIIQDHIDEASYLIVFDELDEDYKNLSDPAAKDQYSSLVTGLFKAVQDVKALFRAPRYLILPVIFLRDDIFETLKDPDKAKWSDLSIELDWTTDKIKQVLAFRISRAIDPNGRILSFDEAWAKVFRPDPIGRDGEKKFSVFSFITRSTFIRPRDYIRYIRDCAKAARDRGVGLVDADLVKRADKTYSAYLRSELEDEAREVLPEIKEVLDVLAALQKDNFKADEFARAYALAIKDNHMPHRDVKYILDILFRFSAIGNQRHGERNVFRYLNRDAKYNLKAPFCIHRGLFRSLQIV